LAEENPGKYVKGLDYKSPDFRLLVERAIDTNGDNRISNYEYIRFLVILRSMNRDGWLEGRFYGRTFTTFIFVDSAYKLQSCSGFSMPTKTIVSSSPK
jgi:hypothetical protein